MEIDRSPSDFYFYILESIPNTGNKIGNPERIFPTDVLFLKIRAVLTLQLSKFLIHPSCISVDYEIND